MEAKYHARDRTVIKNSRDGLTVENLHTKEAESISKKEKAFLLNEKQTETRHKTSETEIVKKSGKRRKNGLRYKEARHKNDTDRKSTEHRSEEVTYKSESVHNDAYQLGGNTERTEATDEWEDIDIDEVVFTSNQDEKNQTHMMPMKGDQKKKTFEQESAKLHKTKYRKRLYYGYRFNEGNEPKGFWRREGMKAECSSVSKGENEVWFSKRGVSDQGGFVSSISENADSICDEHTVRSKRLFSDIREDPFPVSSGMAFASHETVNVLEGTQTKKQSDIDEISGEIIRDGVSVGVEVSKRITDVLHERRNGKEKSSRLRFETGRIYNREEKVRQNPKFRQKRMYRKAYQSGRWNVGIPKVQAGTRQGGSSGIRKTVEGIQRILSEGRNVKIGIVIVMLFTIVTIFSAFYGCVAAIGGLSSIMATTYPSKDADIKGAENTYCALENALDDQINSMEQTHPGYDEYRYQVDEITHNPFQLTSLLSAKHGNYTITSVTGYLEDILNLQYELSVTEEVEIRTRTVYDSETGEESEEEYEYYILNIVLKNRGLDFVAGVYLTAEQKELYDAYNTTLGNRKELFDESMITANPGGGAGGVDYEIPPEALADTQFARMIGEAEKYLGYPYVWSGSSPSTSFDCSGFVSWVINHSGNGWDVGRQTAEGLRHITTAVSPDEAKPGDLIFFEGTYNTSGASHVGIYVGDGMMIHCGDPIQYSNINTDYWQSHFYQFGRL